MKVKEFMTDDNGRTLDEYVCASCSEPCSIVEETFDYSGTHCTHGQSGTHHTGVYKSDCCLDDYEVKYE